MKKVLKTDKNRIERRVGENIEHEDRGTERVQVLRSEVPSDLDRIYIDILCERFRGRGISRSAKDEESKRRRSMERLRRAGVLTASLDENVHAKNFMNGKMSSGERYMTPNDFREFYNALREPRPPRFFMRSESEFAAAGREGEDVSPKKAGGLTIMMKELGEALRSLPKRINPASAAKFSAEWFPPDAKEARVNMRGRKMNVKFPIYLSIVLLCFTMLICSSVMVSRAYKDLSIEKDNLEYYVTLRDRLAADLEIKNDMLNIRDIATGEYGMVSGDFVNSQYIGADGEEGGERVKGEKDRSFIDTLLSAIGIK